MKVAEQASTGKNIPLLKVATLHHRHRTGRQQRTYQQYRGVVIRISGHGEKKRHRTQDVRKCWCGTLFPIESPFIEYYREQAKSASQTVLRVTSPVKARTKENALDQNGILAHGCNSS